MHGRRAGQDRAAGVARAPGRPHRPLSRRDLSGWRRRVPNISLLWFYDARWARRIRELVSDVGRFDAIHVHDLPLVRTAQRAAKRMGAFVVADLHENYPMVLPFYTMGRSLSPVGRFLVAPRRWERYEKKSAPHLLGGDRGHRRDESLDSWRSVFRQIGSSSSRTWWIPSGSLRTRWMLRCGSGLRDRYVITYVGGFDAVARSRHRPQGHASGRSRRAGGALDARRGRRDQGPNSRV